MFVEYGRKILGGFVATGVLLNLKGLIIYGIVERFLRELCGSREKIVEEGILREGFRNENDKLNNFLFLFQSQLLYMYIYTHIYPYFYETPLMQTLSYMKRYLCKRHLHYVDILECLHNEGYYFFSNLSLMRTHS